jgi:hypothetical protein
MAENPKIKKIKLSGTTYDLQDETAARSEDLLYTNSTKIVNGLGSIKPGDTFDRVPIKTVLDKILYPYVDITVSFTSIDNSTGEYVVHNLPKVQSVSFTVQKNSATDIVFKLWDTTNDQEVATKSGDDIVDDKLIFSGLNITVDTTRTFELRYSYTGDSVSESKICDVGTFTIKFQNPSNPSITKTVNKNSAGGTDTIYYCGEALKLQTITTDISSLNSASVTGGITKIELYKGSTKVGATVNNPAFPYTFILNESLESATNTTFTYKVKAYYNTRAGSSTTTTETSLVSNNLTITFSYISPSVTTITGIPSGTFSKLDPQSITNPTCNFKKNSGKITQVKLLDGTSEKAVNDNLGYTDTVYDAGEKSSTFEYTDSNICSNKTFYVKAYENTTEVASKSVSMSFYAPYCWGFVDATTTFDSINLDLLTALASQNQAQTFTSKNINTTGPAAQKKFLFIAPGTSFTKVADPAGNDAMTSFEKGGQKITITFADGKTTQEYQVFLAAKAAADAAINYTFS